MLLPTESVAVPGAPPIHYTWTWQSSLGTTAHCLHCGRGEDLLVFGGGRCNNGLRVFLCRTCLDASRALGPRCENCGASAAQPCLDAYGVCGTCLEHEQEAHDALYGDEECRFCRSVLVGDDEWSIGVCGRCDGVEPAHEEDDDEEDGV